MTDEERVDDAFLLILLALAFGATWLGFYVLKRHRNYYLDALLLKSALEQQLGLRQPVGREGPVTGVVPWQIVSDDELDEALKDPTTWRRRTVLRRGTISWALGVSYVAMAVFDITAMVFVIIR